MGYPLVLPRDAFKQGLLLKNIGRLSLLILDGLTNGLKLTEEFKSESFDIGQSDGGEIYLADYTVYLNETPIEFYIPMHAREGWCLRGSYEDGDGFETFPVFDDEGNLSPDWESIR